MICQGHNKYCNTRQSDRPKRLEFNVRELRVTRFQIPVRVKQTTITFTTLSTHLFDTQFERFYLRSS